MKPTGSHRSANGTVTTSLAVREIKRASALYLEQGERAAFDEIATMRQRTANSKDFAEGIRSFREKRAAVFRGR